MAECLYNKVANVCKYNLYAVDYRNVLFNNIGFLIRVWTQQPFTCSFKMSIAFLE